MQNEYGELVPQLVKEYAIMTTAPSDFNPKGNLRTSISPWTFSAYVDAEDHLLWIKGTHAEIREKAANEVFERDGNEYHLKSLALDRTTYKIVERVVSAWKEV